MFFGTNINHIKQANVSTVLQILLRSGPISRVQLAELTSLSNTTITNLTAELIEIGLITEESSEKFERSITQRPVGRPRRMLRLIPNSRYVVGVHIGIGLFRVAVANIEADLVCSRILEFDPASPAFAVLEAISNCIKDVVKKSNVDPTRVLGIGVGVSGLVNHQEGVNVFAPRLNWRNVKVKSILETHLGYPTCIDNNVRAMALGESFFGAGKDVDVLAFVYGRVGVGAGFVVNGHIFQGSGAGAGEIGHSILFFPGHAPNTLDRPDKYETLETLVSEWAILKEATSLEEAHPDSVLANYMSDSKIAPTPIERVFAAARAGDQLTREMIERRAQYLGIALANLTNTLNPELILLGGMFAQGEDLIIPVAEATLKRLAFADLGEKVHVQPTTFGWRAGVVGASALALANFMYQPSI